MACTGIVQGRLRAAFADHLGIVTAYHGDALAKAMGLLLQGDADNGWRAAGGGPGRLASARAVMLECRKQADNALTVVAGDAAAVQSFEATIAEALVVRAPAHASLPVLYHTLDLWLLS